VKQVAGDVAGQGAVALINVDDNGAAGQKYGIRGIPALIVLKDGKVIVACLAWMLKRR
jgi:thioredoxin 1